MVLGFPTRHDTTGNVRHALLNAKHVTFINTGVEKSVTFKELEKSIRSLNIQKDDRNFASYDKICIYIYIYIAAKEGGAEEGIKRAFMAVSKSEEEEVLVLGGSLMMMKQVMKAVGYSMTDEEQWIPVKGSGIHRKCKDDFIVTPIKALTQKIDL